MKNILVTGRGGAGGSWNIRGNQLGKAIGATIDVTANSVKGYDAAIVVKRPRPDVIQRLRQRGLPIIWDVVDAWPQPSGNEWQRDDCMAWLKEAVEEVKPAGIIAATQAMADDCAEFKVPVLVLPHHSRPTLRVNAIREHVSLVGYEGGEQYLGDWRAMLEKECHSRGWKFVVNPPSIVDLDIVVAVRAQRGYAPRHWKSGVKAANAQGSGTPCILNRERGCWEIRTGGELWADSYGEMSQALDVLRSKEVRQKARSLLLHNEVALHAVARRYREWLEETVLSS